MSSELTDKDRIALLEKAASGDEAKTQVSKTKARNLLSSADILFEKRRIWIKELENQYFEYCMLTYDEMTALLKQFEDLEDIQELNKKALYLRLHKADPSVTEDLVGQLPAPFVNLMLKYINEEEERFLLPVFSSASNTLKRMSQAVDSGNSVST